MLTIKNIENVKYQKVTVKGKEWRISNVLDWPDEYTFHLTNGIESIKVEMDRHLRSLYYNGEVWILDDDDIKTMWAFVRTLHKVLNDK